MAYDTTSSVPKQSCSKKSNIVPFVLMTNHRPVIACYLLQYDISSWFHIFSLFLSIKGFSDITAKQTLFKCNRNSGNMIEAVIPVWPSYVTESKTFRSKIAILGLWVRGLSQKLWVLGRVYGVYQEEDLNCFKANFQNNKN